MESGGWALDGHQSVRFWICQPRAVQFTSYYIEPRLSEPLGTKVKVCINFRYWLWTSQRLVEIFNYPNRTFSHTLIEQSFPSGTKTKLKGQTFSDHPTTVVNTTHYSHFKTKLSTSCHRVTIQTTTTWQVTQFSYSVNDFKIVHHRPSKLSRGIRQMLLYNSKLQNFAIFFSKGLLTNVEIHRGAFLLLSMVLLVKKNAYNCSIRS